MSVHSLPTKRRSGDGARARPASDARLTRAREGRRRVLIRRSWVRAAAESTASDHDLTFEVIARVRDRRAA